MPGKVKTNWAEVEQRRTKILFAQVVSPAGFLYFTGYRRPVPGRDVKFFYGYSVYEVTAKLAFSLLRAQALAVTLLSKVCLQVPVFSSPPLIADRTS